ncbi:hypothetical protein CEXT_85541 [Caerostris extrusa]|uniref:Uncharacterized protein n=1 Tax=Caerostris extrusa TaxID=172846 RepID=A0AAV4XF32_CAEEX|nr:hypothetical protein CEXT_85541 [Caerostris extrusa]
MHGGIGDSRNFTFILNKHLAISNRFRIALNGRGAIGKLRTLQSVPNSRRSSVPSTFQIETVSNRVSAELRMEQKPR